LHVRESSGLPGIFGIHAHPVPELLDSKGLSGVFIHLYFPKEFKRYLSVPTTQFMIQCFLQGVVCTGMFDLMTRNAFKYWIPHTYDISHGFRSPNR
jgi:hypothetical protein